LRFPLTKTPNPREPKPNNIDYMFYVFGGSHYPELSRIGIKLRIKQDPNNSG